MLPAAEYQRTSQFEHEKKRVGLALAWELLPGAGSLYAHHARGAVLTWGLMIGGAVAAIAGISLLGGGEGAAYRADSPAAMPLLLGGLMLAVFGHGYGFVSAYRATDRYNVGLRARLGLPDGPSSSWSR